MKKLLFLISIVLICVSTYFVVYAKNSINTVKIDVIGENYDDNIKASADGEYYSLTDCVVYPDKQEVHLILSASDGYYFNIYKASNIHLRGCKFKNASRQNDATTLYVVVQLDNAIGYLKDRGSSVKGWKQDANGWWWDNGDGTYPKNCWKWIDDNVDGRYECYYFDPNGYCLMNTTTPDGYTVNPQGKWISNGTVMYRTSENGITMSDTNNANVNKTKKSAQKDNSAVSNNTAASNNTAVSNSTTGGIGTYVLNTNTRKFHYFWCDSVSKMSSKNKRIVTWPRSDIISAGYVPCKNCNP